MNLLGHYHTRHPGIVHRLPAGLKLGVALGLILGTALLPARWHWWFVGVAAVLTVYAVAGRIAPGFLFKRLVLLAPFVLGVALMNALHPTPGSDWRLLALRGGLCLVTVILVSSTTPFSEVLRVLRRVRVPALLITTLALMHRYLFVLAEEAERMRRARAGRTFTRKRRVVWSVLATVASHLFVRASERAERVYDAMWARGGQ